MFGLTQLGIVHTAISLIAVGAGPGVTETTTRLPLGAPLLPNADAPQLQVASGVLFVLFLIGATLQVRWLRSQHTDDLRPRPV